MFSIEKKTQTIQQTLALVLHSDSGYIIVPS